MTSAIDRKGGFAGLLIAVISFAIALPFNVVHPVLPFVIVLVGYGLIVMMVRWRWLPPYYNGYLAGCLVALIILLPTASMLKFLEQGFDNGPFYSTPYTGIVSGESASERLDYRQGELLIYNRAANKAPILAYRTEVQTHWAEVLDVSQNAQYEPFQLRSIESAEIHYGLIRDRLDFIGNWNFGAETGRAYLWKWNGLQRFYLSW
ncbi:MAG: hypothetical protein ACFBSG_05535 [Leptolyngbyaceae cyanobacterium]